jgi:hypothetical protein
MKLALEQTPLEMRPADSFYQIRSLVLLDFAGIYDS